MTIHLLTIEQDASFFQGLEHPVWQAFGMVFENAKLPFTPTWLLKNPYLLDLDNLKTELEKLTFPLQMMPILKKEPDDEPELLFLKHTSEFQPALKNLLGSSLDLAGVLFFHQPQGIWWGRIYMEWAFPTDLIRIENEQSPRQYQDWPREKRVMPSGLPLCLEFYAEVRQVLVEYFKKMDLEICWVVQDEHFLMSGLRPLDAQILRNEIFSCFNLQELLPAPLSPLMQSIIVSSEESVFDFYRQFDEQLPTERALIEAFQARPYINQSLLTEVFQQWGRSSLPNGLSIAPLSYKIENRISARQRYNFYRLRVGKKVIQTSNRMMETFQIPHTRLSGYLGQIQEIYSLLLKDSLVVQDALRSPLQQLSEWGLLEQWNQHCEMVITRWFEDLIPLREMAQNKIMELGRRPEPEELLKQKAFRMAWKIYLSNHGHRALNEMSLDTPRFDEDQDLLLNLILSPWRASQSTEDATIKGHLAKPFWRRLRHLLRLREKLYSDALWSMYQVKKQMVPLINKLVQSQFLPDTQVFWLLNNEEINALEKGRSSFDWSEIKSRAKTQISYPELRHRFDKDEAPTRKKSETDLSLTGTHYIGDNREGVVWLPQTDEIILPQGFQPWKTILIIPLLHPGLMPYLAQVAAVVCESGSTSDLGTLMLYEVGIPAILGVKYACSLFSTGDFIQLEQEFMRVVKKEEMEPQG